MSFRLYDLTHQYQELLDLITDSEVEHQGFADTLESIEDAIEDKLDNTAKVIKTLEAEAKAIKEEEDRLKKRRSALENNAKRLKAYAQDALIATGKDKIKGPLFTIAIQKNPPSVKLLDETLIPKGYFFEQAPKLDKKEVLQDLKLGLEVPGAEIQQGESLRIR